MLCEMGVVMVMVVVVVVVVLMVLGGAGGLWRDDGYSPCRPTDTLTTHWDGISTKIYIIGWHEVGVFYPSPHPWFDTNVWSFATRKWKEILRKEKSWTWFDVGRLGTGQKNYNLQPFCFSSVLSPPNEDFFGKQQIYSLQQFVSLSVAVS